MGGVTGSAFYAFIIVTIMAGLFLGGAGAFSFAGLSIVSALGMLIAQNNGVLPEPMTPTSSPLSNWMILAMFLLISAALLHIATRNLNEALSRARSNEQDLAQSNRELLAIRASLEQHNEHLRRSVELYAEHMAEVGRGNLASRVRLDDNGSGPDDPLVILGHRLNESTANLQAMIQQIHQVAGNLTAAAAEILAASTQQAAGASEQASAITQASSTIEEVRTIAEQTSQRAQAVAELTQRTTDVSTIGQQSVTDTVAGMAEIRDKVESIAEEILGLSEQAQAIGAIIAAVGEIAAQSNMLALNAAVEAARAGEAGRGFSIVAQEVRSLAEQSRAATNQVEEILSQIQRGVNTAVMATEEGMKGAATGVTLASEAGNSIQRLADEVGESTQSARQIAAAVSQQLSGISQIALAMENIDQVTLQSVSGAHQVEQAAGELNVLAGRLRTLVEQYRL
jgi:methyl-accepting chemotaxis protein